MREVIRIDKEEKADEKPVVFKALLSASRGWEDVREFPFDYEKVVYLGKCKHDGDMFATFDSNGVIDIFKGYLNSGKY